MIDQDMERKTSRVAAAATDIVQQSDILKNQYFAKLANGEMTRDEFIRSQRQFYFAVEFFSRPMSALLMRVPSGPQRLGILENVVEEHGNFDRKAFHEATFRQFLGALGDSEPIDRDEVEPAAHAFNSAIMAACLSDSLRVGIGCLGIIELAFADISALIGNAVVGRGWLTEDALVHYTLHAELDKKHAADFFELVEADWNEPEHVAEIERGLRLGVYVFDRLYKDLLS